MTAKEYLMQYREAMRRTQAITVHLAELRAVCEQLRTEDGHRVALDKAVADLVDTEAKTAAAMPAAPPPRITTLVIRPRPPG